MNATENLSPSPGRSWRNIRQEVSAPAMSRQGRRRRLRAWFKVTAGILLAGAVGWSGYLLVHSWRTDRAALASAAHSEPVRDIVLHTDGVLPRQWVADTLALPAGASLMSLDLPALRDRLLQSGQVQAAVLSRNFPDVLVVTLAERQPVARVQASAGDGSPRQLLVARDGVVYEGVNNDPKTLASLPWLDGIRLVKAGHGFEPIAGMADVATLLATAKNETRSLYDTWLIVSLARLADRDEIIVKAQDIPEIVFSRKRDFLKQLAQLDYVVDAAHSLPTPTLQSVNLSLDGQVPVRMAGSPEELLKASAAPNFQLNPPTRKGKRDL